jgi:hypothetical protein
VCLREVVIEALEDHKLIAEEAYELFALRATRDVLEGGGEDRVWEGLRVWRGEGIEEGAIEVRKLAQRFHAPRPSVRGRILWGNARPGEANACNDALDEGS